MFGGFESNPEESAGKRAREGDRASGVSSVPVSYDLEPGESAAVKELKERRRERREGPDQEPSQTVAEGLDRLLKEHPEYRERNPGQIACRLHMSRYMSFVPTDEEVEAAMKEAQ